MARGKIKIKRIENSTNRQVTYSKRRNGLFKKANELSVLCDSTVSIIMLSSTNRVHQFLSPGVSTKEIYDRYQQTLQVDIWESHYQKMQEELQQVIEINRGLQREIRQRMGECLEDLSFSELQCLGQSVENAADVIRAQKRFLGLEGSEETSIRRSLTQLWRESPLKQQSDLSDVHWNGHLPIASQKWQYDRGHQWGYSISRSHA